MIASFLIIGFSLGLLAYWFRYTCVLLLRSFAEQPSLISSIGDQRFGFSEVQRQLAGCSQLDPLQQLLERDYRLLTYLLQHAAGLSLDSLEDRLLVLDYRVMAGYYRLTRTLAPEQARRALAEMASVVSVLAGRIGEQAGLQAQS